ncbi:hypothetical protein SRDD_39610 [Serratia sp. DD3]|nr:hypothetical protein SRDD_39610 [Serratia sp. DD3]
MFTKYGDIKVVFSPMDRMEKGLRGPLLIKFTKIITYALI